MVLIEYLWVMEPPHTHSEYDFVKRNSRVYYWIRWNLGKNSLLNFIFPPMEKKPLVYFKFGLVYFRFGLETGAIAYFRDIF